MTTISAATSTTTYSYTKNQRITADDISSCIPVSSSNATTTDQSDDDTSSSAEKLVAQLMALAMSQYGTQSSTEESQSDAAADVANLDSNSDGLVSRAEFVSARPSDITEDQAGVLFDSFDSESAGSLSVDALSEAMASRPAGPGGPPPSADSDDEDDDTLEALLQGLDTNGDGVVTADEFAAGLSADSSDTQARELFDFLNGSDNSSLPPPPAADDATRTADPSLLWSAISANDEEVQSVPYWS